MHIDILTLFPEMFSGPFSESMIKRAVKKGIVTIKIHNLRSWARDIHKTTDDRPYGGGPGMVMLVEPIDRALTDLKSSTIHHSSSIILTSAKGNIFTQAKAKQLSKLDHLVFIAGHYEGVDERVAENLVDEELSIGNYVLTGGELPAVVMVDAIVRLLPGFLGDPESLKDESHNLKGYLEYPQYSRPETYRGWRVPEILLSGHHAEIKAWQHTHSEIK